jgi:xanthine dehydrogenase YagR molybdenum-binding subunit
MTRLSIAKGDLRDGNVELVEHDPLPPWSDSSELKIVGQPFPRVEGRAKVTGHARYSYDVRLPGQLYARVLRSPFPHARITRIDTSKAEQLPGVGAVLSSASEPEIAWYEDSFLFDPTVRFFGDEVAAVAAISEEIADDALRLISVEYEQLPFATDLETALRDDAPQLRPRGNLAGEPKIYDRGNVAAGFEAAEVIIDQIYTTHAALHNCLEPHGCTADWDGDQLTLWDSTQSIFTVREEVAKKLEIAESNVRVIKQFMGGGFGSKQISWKSDVIAALLAKQAGKPVQLMLDREAENLAVGHRNVTHQHVRLGAKRDGTLTAISAEIAQGVGAYQTGGEASDTPGTYQTLYQCANVHTTQTAVYLNTGPAVAFRAPGYFEGAAALESAMDELARELKLDPFELRLRNYAERDQQSDKPYSLPEALRRCYEEVREHFDWDAEIDRPVTGPKRRGIGMAAHDWIGGAGHPPGYAWIKLNADGTADVITGTQDIGTGTRTGLSQVAAEELGLPFDAIRLHLGDTGNGPYAPVSSGSATQATIGPAIRAAAADARKQLLDLAAQLLDASPADLTIADGKIIVSGAPEERSIAVREICAAIAPTMIQGRGSREPNPADYSVHTFGAQCVEIELDLETGHLTIVRIAASHDCGRIVNPTMVESQISGAVIQGIGFATTEGQIIDTRLGLVLNPNLEEYKVPTVADIPHIDHAPIDLPDLIANPIGAKGVGEPPLIPTTPAIANAIFDATGLRLRDTPFSRARLLRALAEQAREMETAP